VFEIEAGARLTNTQGRRRCKHGQLLERAASDARVCRLRGQSGATFDATLDWPHEIEGVRMQHYIEWMKSAYLITATWCPAISVPAGFTPDGLPVGIQIVGRFRDDFGVLQMGHAFEQATHVGRRRPIVA
jgi:amidase